MYDLYIANKNYSSWSLRPWVLMRTLDIPFNEKLVPFGDPAFDFKTFSPTGRVPCLVHDGVTVWDSLSIVEYLAERHEKIWPQDEKARAWARSASAEMHSGFNALRNDHTMNIGLRIRPNTISQSLQNDIDRIDTLWQQGLEQFGGPFLAGSSFTAVDAFFSPVAFRFQTYGTKLSAISQEYMNRILSMPHIQNWQQDALQETWRDEAHELDARAIGEWTQDLRVTR